MTDSTSKFNSIEEVLIFTNNNKLSYFWGRAFALSSVRLKKTFQQKKFQVVKIFISFKYVNIFQCFIN